VVLTAVGWLDLSAVAAALAGVLSSWLLLAGGGGSEGAPLRRRRAIAVGVLASLLPLAWGLSRLWLPWWDASLPGAAVGLRVSGLAVTALVVSATMGWSAAYLAVLLHEPDFVRAEPGEATGRRSAGGRSTAGRASPAAVASPLPTLRTAEGAVSSPAPGRDEDSERDGLLRTLKEGPDFLSAAAAKALALSCSGSRQPRVLAALVDASCREDLGVSVRAEAVLALYRVLGESVPTDVEVTIRRDFPSGVDWDFVEACRALGRAARS